MCSLSYFHHTLNKSEKIALPVIKNTKIEAVEKVTQKQPKELLEEPKVTEVQVNVAPVYYAHINKHNNIFSQIILGGYCLSNHYNAQLAARSINNTIIQPQEIFSFNSKAGPYTANRGYVPSTVIVSNRYVQGMGGGVCRISTALYNAAIDAGLPVIESHRHTMPVGYAKPGRDAAVAYGILDLKLKNNKDNPIQIITKTSNGIIYVAFVDVQEETIEETSEEILKEAENILDEADTEKDVETEISNKGEC
jgi:vancomycin resistance protein YoaR